MAKKTPAAKPKTSKPAAKKKVAVKPPTEKLPQSPADRKAFLQRQIEALQGEMVALQEEAVEELKRRLSDARQVVATLEEELSVLTGKPAGEPKTKRIRRPSITDDALKDQLLKVMAHHGQSGMNAKQLAEKLHQDAIRIRKFITDNPKLLRRTGNGAGTRFFLQ